MNSKVRIIKKEGTAQVRIHSGSLFFTRYSLAGQALFAFSFLLSSFSLFLTPVYAQTGAVISVQPEIFTKSLSRGETWEDILTIVNGSEIALPVHLAVVRWDASDETGGVTFIEEREDASFDATSWFTLSETDMIVEPFEARIIPFRVVVPPNAEPGGKYVSIWVDPRIPDIYFGDQPVRIIPRITPLFLLDIPVFDIDEVPQQATTLSEFAVKNRAELLSSVVSRFASLFRAPRSAFAADPAVSVDVLSGTPESLLLRIKNSGITHIKPSGTLVVRNVFGREVARSTIEPTTILPGKTREMPVSLALPSIPLLPRALERQLALGRYTAQAVITVIGEEPVLASLTYWIFPWQGMFWALLFFGGGGLTIFRFRRRFVSAFRILLRGRALKN